MQIVRYLTLYILILIFINCSDNSKTPLPTVDPEPVTPTVNPEPVTPKTYTIKPKQVEGGKILDFEISVDQLPYTFGINQNLDKVFVGFKNVLDTHFEIKDQDAFVTTILLKETLGQKVLNSNLILTPIYEDAKTIPVKTISNIDIEFKIRKLDILNPEAGSIIFTKDIIPYNYEITSLARVNFDYVDNFGDILKNARKDNYFKKDALKTLNGFNYKALPSDFSEGEIQITVSEMDSLIINNFNVKFEKEFYDKTNVRDSIQKLLDDTYRFFKDTDAGDYLNQIDILNSKGRTYDFAALGGGGIITLLGLDTSIETMIHEMGHVWENRPDGPFLNLADNAIWKNLYNNHFVTQYGATNIQEYFADSFMLYFYEKEQNILAEQLNNLNTIFEIPLYTLPKEVRSELDKYFMK